MGVIITATDFSEIADNAVRYACALAADLGMHVTILHAYAIPVTFHENPMPVISMEESKSIAEAQLDKLTNDLYRSFPRLGITPKLCYGDVVDNLKECIEECKADLVIIGNSSGEDSTFWLGSNLLDTLRNMPCPAIAIPTAYSYKKVEHIAFACDFQHLSAKIPVADMVTLAQITGAQMHVLNVDNKHTGDADTSAYEPALLKNELQPANPQYHTIEHENIDEGIQSFVATNNMDWLVVVPHRYNFFEGLFRKSHTKEIVRHAHIPLVALHER